MRESSPTQLRTLRFKVVIPLLALAVISTVVGRAYPVPVIFAISCVAISVYFLLDRWVLRPLENRLQSLATGNGREHPPEIEAKTAQSQDIAESHREALRANRMKSDFLAITSHEMRTPLNGILGMTSLLMESHPSPEQKEYIQTLERCGAALKQTVNDILDISKIEAGKLDLECIDFDLKACFEEMGDIVAHRAHAKNLELVIDVHPDLPVIVRGDSNRLRQIVLNLANNAIKFTPEGEVVIRARAEQIQDHRLKLHVSISDTGIGIPSNRLDRLFQLYNQAESSTQREYGGTGLGLAICKKLVECMDGRIGVDSEDGKGSTFWFTVALDFDADLQDELKTLPSIEGLRVMAVGSSDSCFDALESQLRPLGCTFVRTSTAAIALQDLDPSSTRSQPFDVILYDFHDLSMPPADFALGVRNQCSSDELILILLTPVNHTQDAINALQAGFSDYIAKPVKSTDLLAKIASSIKKDRAIDSMESAASKTSKAVAARRDVHLLMVEDDRENQKVQLGILECLGYRCDVAHHGLEALKMMARRDYDLILMDCVMPKMDGFMATRAIRAKEGDARHTPIIAVTAQAMKGDREKCLEAGMDDYIAKPVTKTEFEEVLARHLAPAPDEPAQGPSAISPLAGPPIDLDRITGGSHRQPEIILNMISLFLTNTSKRISLLDMFCHENTLSDAAKVARKLKGSSARVGADGLEVIAAALERQCKLGEEDPSRATLDQLKSEFERLEKFLDGRVLFGNPRLRLDGKNS